MEVPARRQKRILYVEDNACSQVLVKVHFEKNLGYKVDVAPDVYQALMRLIYRKYDAIILDYKLPFVKPEDAEHALRKARVPICYYTCDPIAAKEANIRGLPVVDKTDYTTGGLKGLERVLNAIMDMPLDEDYDKTQHFDEAQLQEICKKPTLEFPRPHPDDDERGRFDPEKREAMAHA